VSNVQKGNVSLKTCQQYLFDSFYDNFMSLTYLPKEVSHTNPDDYEQTKMACQKSAMQHLFI
jgi:hypothetical protein